MTQDLNSRQPVILSAVRTPMGRFQGALAPLGAVQLGAAVVREAVRRAGLDDPAAMGAFRARWRRLARCSSARP